MIEQQKNDNRDKNQQFKHETKQLLDLAEKGLSEIKQLQQDYSYQQLNDCLDMDELETILDNLKKAESANNNKENTPENLNFYLTLNIQSFEKLEKMVESSKGKNKIVPAKEERTEQK
ncbi:unnamed protein product [Paramecium primaurelia]|uniref:Uncharacterized protein n=1 Tax=Paramecium primaurelia TaxID=5886 RepID=A0A8S1QBU1_PARPR|nr:unnamed protein product [Paramecium primaurelia]